MLFDFDRLEAERRFDLASGREAASSAAHVLHAYFYLLPRGRADDAVKELEKVMRDDPLNGTLHRALAISLHEAGRTAEASRELHEALELDEHSFQTMMLLAMDYWTRGLTDEAIAWAERAYSLTSWHPMPMGLYAGMLSRGEERARARRVLEKIADGRTYGAPLGLAVFHLLVGEIDTAIDWLDKLVRQRHVAGAYLLLYSPLGKQLMSSHRWPALARILHLPEKRS